MSARKPIHDDFDAIVDFFPPDSPPNFAYGLVKVTYERSDRGWRRAKAEPLYHDIRLPDTKPLWAPGSDFWPTKLQTDVAVRGSAYVAQGRPVASSRVRVQVGQRSKGINVYGDRQVLWNDRGKVQFGPAEPFAEMPIVWERAYGGWDRRVPTGIDPMTVADMARLEVDHPGMYPRNPMGRGYLVVDAPCDGVLLPNLEDPLQPLMPETYVTRDPALWYRQPLPACFEYTNAMMFHRLCWLGAGAWFHPPAGAELAEVRAGVLPPDYLSLRGMLVSTPQVLQEGAIGLVFDPLPASTPIVVEGMHPEVPRVEFAIPAPPRVEFSIEGKLYPAPIQLTNVLVEPGKLRFSLTYAALLEELPRVFIPGIHAKIPLSLRIDRTHTVPYECPPTLRELRRGAAGQGGTS